MIGLLSGLKATVIAGAVAAVVAGAGSWTYQEIRWRGKWAEREQVLAVAQAAVNANALRASENQILRTQEERVRYEKEIARGRVDLRRALERLRDYRPGDAGPFEGGGASGGDDSDGADLLALQREAHLRLASRADDLARRLALGQRTITELVRVVESCGRIAQ